MKIIEPGHIYQLEHQDGSGAGLLVFVNREAGTEHEGTQTQEVLRALIDRTQHCDSCKRWDGNDKIIHHLRMALALHEARALERKTEKGELKPETVATASDGHFKIEAKSEGRRTVEVGGKTYELHTVRVTEPKPEPAKLPAYDDLMRDARAAVDRVAYAPRGLRYEPSHFERCVKCGGSYNSGEHWVGPNRHDFVFAGDAPASFMMPRDMPHALATVERQPASYDRRVAHRYRCVCGEHGPWAASDAAARRDFAAHAELADAGSP